MFASVVRFDSLHLFSSIVTANLFVLPQLDVMAAVLYGKRNERKYMRLPEVDRDRNTVEHLK
jgi:hypothetical protein